MAGQIMGAEPCLYAFISLPLYLGGEGEGGGDWKGQSDSPLLSWPGPAQAAPAQLGRRWN